jgi:membrane protease YdiL (CAAX protease family)
MKNTTILRISLFYLTAISVSNIFRFQLFGYEAFEKELSNLALKFTYPLQSIGILIGAFTAMQMMKRKKQSQYSIFGSSPLLSLVSFGIPIIFISFIGFQGSGDMNTHLSGFISAIFTFLYCFFEEIGWRGYLHDELKKMNQFTRALLIGFLWWFWHLSFIDNPSIISNLIFLLILIISAWGLGKLIKHTKSILMAASFHMIINIWFLNSEFETSMQYEQRLIVIGISAILYIVILIFWNRIGLQKNTE